MVVVLQASNIGGGGGGSGEAPARNQRGSHASVPSGTTVTLVSFVASDYKLRGFVAFGTTDFVAWVEVDSVELPGIIARGTITKVASLILPNPETYASPSSIVALKLRNESALPPTTGDFEGTLLGE